VDVGALIRDERLRLVDRLAAVQPDDWDTPSLCEGWTVRQVLAHLATPFLVSAPSMAVNVVRARGISAAMDTVAKKLAQRPTQELLDVLKRNADTTFRPPGLPLAAPLTDIVVHSADIRWALGDARRDWADVARLRPVLDFVVSPRAWAGFVPRGRTRGLRLVAEDQDWTHGEGAEVRGPSLALARGVLGRSDALALLRGDGAASLVR
jgi:uncharacterized protein (TIGR03083 family)